MAVMMVAPATAMADDFDGDGFEDIIEDFGFFPFFTHFAFEVEEVDCDGFDGGSTRTSSASWSSMSRTSTKEVILYKR